MVGALEVGVEGEVITGVGGGKGSREGGKEAGRDGGVYAWIVDSKQHKIKPSRR